MEVLQSREEPETGKLFHHRFHRSTSKVIVDSQSDKPLIFVQSVVLSTLVYLYLFQFDNPLITASSEFQMR